MEAVLCVAGADQCRRYSQPSSPWWSPRRPSCPNRRRPGLARWKLVPTDSGYYKLTAGHTGDRTCLDVAYASTAHTANVIQANCWTPGYNQQWRFAPTDNGWFSLVARHSGKCLDVANMVTYHTGNVIQGTCWGGYNQQWRLEAVG